MYRPGSTLQHFKSISSNIVTQGAASPKYKLNVVDAMDQGNCFSLDLKKWLRYAFKVNLTRIENTYNEGSPIDKS